MTRALDQRSAQIHRVIHALKGIERDRAIAIICMWMSADDVEAMLKTLEHQDGVTT
jgi:hypothetical protein